MNQERSLPAAGRLRCARQGGLAQDDSASQYMNSCAKYGKWIEEAAVGALAPKRERELLAHISTCEACREAYQHAREIAAVVDGGVRSLVAGEPSAQFAARLRARIAEEHTMLRFPWLTWKPIGAGLVSAVALALLIVLLLPKHRRFGPNGVRPNPNTTSAANIQSPAAVESPATHPSRHAGQSPIRRGYRTPAQDRTVAERTRPSFRRHNSPAEPEVIVPPGQLEAVMQLAADIRSGQIDGRKFLAEQAEVQKNMQKPIDIAPMEIKPIEIPPLPIKPAEAPSDSTAP